MLAIAGAVAIGAGIYYYHNNVSPSDYLDADPMASTQMGYSYGMPMVVPQGVASGIVDAVSNPAAGTAGGDIGGGLTNLDVFNFEVLKEAHDYDLASRALDANLNIALVNADIAMQGIQATNWQTSANLANAFIRSGQQFVAGNVGGQTFAFLGTGTLPEFGNAARRQAVFQSTLAWVQQMYSGGFTSGIQSGSGSLSVTPYGGSTSTASGSPTGSTSIASTVSGSSAGSGGTAVYDPSAYQAPAVGGSGGGGEGGIVGSQSY